MTTDSPLRTRLRAALLQARRDRDTEAVAALRGVIADLENAEAVPIDHAPAAGAIEAVQIGAGAADAPRRELDEAEEQALVAAEVAAMRAAATTYAEADPARAERLTRAATLVASVAGADEQRA